MIIYYCRVQTEQIVGALLFRSNVANVGEAMRMVSGFLPLLTFH